MKLKDLLVKRMKSTNSEKMTELVEKRTQGEINTFTGMFGNYNMSDVEKANLKEFLEEFQDHTSNIKKDFQKLAQLTQEIKAINNQAALLHGERIKQAQAILKNYKEGAFTTWLIDTYGNRQTPYNLLQYYEFYLEMPKDLRPKIDTMPRQAIYALSSRNISTSKKAQFLKQFENQTKDELLQMIRDQFPLDRVDKRRQSLSKNVLSQLEKLVHTVQKSKIKFTSKQQAHMRKLLDELYRF
ncbi:MAG: hypothetical protein K940chlam8_00273 [Chlamydiae bacterium]|nr:hypothetical protein [Chlamydiota bacterium]